jgi:RNA-directed DNA polymerase
VEGRGVSSSGDALTTVETTPMDRWETLPWKPLQRNVFKRQKRIYRAAGREDGRTVHKLQRLLVRSRAARRLAVRRVAQENHGKRSAGVDGGKSLTPSQRLALAQTLKLGQKAQPVRRVWIPNPQSTERRPLGIPLLANRAGQALLTEHRDLAAAKRFFVRAIEKCGVPAEDHARWVCGLASGSR